MSNSLEVLAFAVRGIALGVAVAAPIGPTGLLCIQRTLAGGVAPGLATGYGAATTHSVYASIAATGLSAIADVIVSWHILLQICAAGTLFYMAVKAVGLTPSLNAGGQPGMSPARAYVTGLAWTLSNPVTLLGFVTLSPGILGQGITSWRSLSLMSIGVLLGSAMWWTVLTVSTNLLRARLSNRSLRYANLITSSCLGAFALALMISALWVILNRM